MEKKKIKVGILIFNEVEVLDFAGPFEVFSISESLNYHEKLFDVFTVSEFNTPIFAKNGLQIVPKYTTSNCPIMDILIIPGGDGADQVEIKNKTLLTWLKNKEGEVEIIASVCTGAFLLAESGILTNQDVTTHWMNINRLQSSYPKLSVKSNKKFIDQGKILTSAGISAGIELSLYIVGKYTTKEVAINTARRMEYTPGESMQRIKLVPPVPEHKDIVIEYKKEFIENGDSMDGTAGLSNSDTFKEWYSLIINNSSEETVGKGLVPASTYLGIRIDDGQLIGMIDIRHRLNDYLFNFGGHIGYSVRKSERQKGYASEMLSLGLEMCVNLDLDKVLITCDSNNKASARTITRNNGILENEVINGGEVIQRYWVKLK